mmetsp:Transcript_12948/g.27375  ORF Transcript_12948/g.27375 Transcript_12948/m.27375 type:complete len:258 (-) Transcript_12948:511-1284(-)
MQRVVPDGKSRGQDAENQEGLSGGLVLDVVLDRVHQEVSELRVHLGDDERKQHGAVALGADVEEVRRDEQLEGVDGTHGDPLGGLYAELHGQTLEAQRGVALDGLEVIHDGNAQPGDGVRQGHHHHLGGELAEEGLARPPGQRDVGGAKGVGALPAVRLELEGGGGVDVGDEGPEEGDGEEGGELVPAQLVQLQRQRPPADQQHTRLHRHVRAGDAAGGDGAVGLVDGVDVAVVPVVDHLGEPGQARPRQEHARQRL